MVKLPISDHVADYYKEQGITFTFRQQAHFCWFYQEYEAGGRTGKECAWD